MDEVPDAVLAELAAAVVGTMPVIAARIPSTPAAELGRLRAIADDDAWPPSRPTIMQRLPAAFRADGGGGQGDATVRDALDSLPPLLTERLLGALELTVQELALTGAPDLTSFLGEPLTGSFGFLSMSGQSEAVTGAARLEQIRPGALPLAAELARRLSTHPHIAPRLSVAPGISGESEVAAAHGAAHLALAVATAAAVLHRTRTSSWATEPPAVLGVAIGAAVLLLRAAPMPASYAAAVLARARKEYLLPRHSAGQAPVSGHRFGLLEGTGVPEAGFSGNGLAAVVEGGVVIRTGAETGHVPVVLRILDGPPPEVEDGWEEIVEVSWHAPAGSASVIGPEGGEPHLRRATPPWPGDYRLRVHAHGRDDAGEDDMDNHGTERYELVVWQAPAAPETVLARTDRLGHRLRGEPEPQRPEPPETAYRWLRHSTLGVSATVTVVTGASAEEVLRAFGADPGQPESLRAIGEELMDSQSIDPWVAVLDTGGAVLAVEDNGWQGSTEPVLARASAGGRAASMFWNVNAMTRLSFAERGEVLLSEEPFGDLDAPPLAAAALTGLDFGDVNRDKRLTGLAAVQRFTGHAFTAEDLARIESADIAFRIVPDLPALYPHPPQPGHPLGPATETLSGLPEPELRELAWWAAAEAARYAGIAGDPDIAASLTAGALTENAHLRARRSQLSGGQHPWVWLALHRATNPDPLTAASDTIDAARYAAGPHAANLLAAAQDRITALRAE